MIKAMFLDMYGTLAGFKPSRYEVQSEACADFEIVITPEGIVKGYAVADAYMDSQNSMAPIRLRGELERETFFAEYERLVLEGCGIDVSIETARRIWRRLGEIPYTLVPFDDVVPTLKALRRVGVVIGMISNINQTGDEIIGTLGLDGCLDFVVTSGEVGVEKPHPAIFQMALKRAGVEPGEAIHVGDQLTSDVEGAMNIGIMPVLLDRDGIHKGYGRCPRVETLIELLALIK